MQQQQIVLSVLIRNKVQWLIWIFLIDQGIKNFLVYSQGFTNFNTGIAWGWGGNINWIWLILILIILLIKKFKFNYWVLSMILGGLSNLIDRFRWGGVVDYLDFFKVFEFNLADAMVFVGVIGLIYKQWVGGKYEDKKDI